MRALEPSKNEKEPKINSKATEIESANNTKLIY